MPTRNKDCNCWIDLFAKAEVEAAAALGSSDKSQHSDIDNMAINSPAINSPPTDVAGVSTTTSPAYPTVSMSPDISSVNAISFNSATTCRADPIHSESSPVVDGNHLAPQSPSDFPDTRGASECPIKSTATEQTSHSDDTATTISIATSSTTDLDTADAIAGTETPGANPGATPDTATHWQPRGEQPTRLHGVARELASLAIDMVTSGAPEPAASRYALRSDRRGGEEIADSGSHNDIPITPVAKPASKTSKKRKHNDAEMDQKDKQVNKKSKEANKQPSEANKKTNITGIVFIENRVRREREGNPTWKLPCCPHD